MNLLLELQLAQSGLNDLFETKGSYQKIGLGDLLLELAQGSIGDVASFNGRSGIVVSQTGDYNTDQVTEASNLYFTQARVLSTVLTGYVSTPGVITPADTILSAIEKLNGNNASQNPGGGQYSIQTNDGSGAFTGDPYFLYNGSQAIFNLVDSWGGLHIKGRSGGEASIALHPDNISDGSAGQWILATNGSGLTNQKDFAIYNAPLGIAFYISQATNNVGINQVNPQYPLDIGGNVNTSQNYYAGGSFISSVAAPTPTIMNTVVGGGVIIQGIDATGYGQLRVAANGGAWQDSQETVYFQLRNSVNNMATFMGGSFGSDAPLDRLQFCSEATSITDNNYTDTPAPTHLLEIINSSLGKSIVSIVDSSGSPGNYLEITSSAGPAGNIFKVDNNGHFTIGTANIKINGISYNWPSSQGFGSLNNDGSGNLYWSTSDSIVNTVTTNDNTPVPIFSMILANTSVYYFEGRVTARYADGSSVEVFHKNVGARAEVSAFPSIMTPGQTTIYESDGLVLNINWVINGSSIELQVTGDASASVNWKCFVNVYSQND